MHKFLLEHVTFAIVTHNVGAQSIAYHMFLACKLERELACAACAWSDCRMMDMVASSLGIT